MGEDRQPNYFDVEIASALRFGRELTDLVVRSWANHAADLYEENKRLRLLLKEAGIEPNPAPAPSSSP